MGFRKTQSVEKVQVLPPAQQQKISSAVHSVGKTSAAELTEKERKSALDVHRNI